MDGADMPETPVDKDGQALGREYDVGISASEAGHMPMNAKPQT